MSDLSESTVAAVSDRIRLLRHELRQAGVDGFVVPVTDEHRSEYLPPSAQRLAWLTGFTGSAGLAVVLVDRAALFVDGRYTLQAKAQLDPTIFELRHLTKEPPEEWLRAHLQSGQRLGFDPALHVKAEVERYRNACSAAGSTLIALQANPVDRIWTTRPTSPMAPIELQDQRYAGASSHDKRTRMGRELTKARAEVAILCATDSIAWLLNARGGDVPFNPLFLGFALLHADGQVELFIDMRKLGSQVRFDEGVSVRPRDGFEAALDGLGGQKRAVLIDPRTTNVAITERLRAAGARVVEGDDPCALAKARKNQVELQGARNAQRRDGAAVCRFLAWLEAEVGKRPLTEMDTAARLDQERRQDLLYRGPSFETVSAAGPNAALPHYRATEQSNRVLEQGTLYLVDSGGQYLDATTDLTRTIAIGQPTEAMSRHFTLVLKGHIAVARAVFVKGANGAQIDGLARAALWRAGLDYDHGTGHGVGAYLCVHEGPVRINGRHGEVELEPGMILSNEPGYYRSGEYGIRTENLVVVISHGTPPGGEREIFGFETLTRVPIDRRLIEPALLEPDERAWLDNYHARVRADLMDLVDRNTASWLLERTRPIAASSEAAPAPDRSRRAP